MRWIRINTHRFHSNESITKTTTTKTAEKAMPGAFFTVMHNSVLWCYSLSHSLFFFRLLFVPPFLFSRQAFCSFFLNYLSLSACAKTHTHIHIHILILSFVPCEIALAEGSGWTASLCRRSSIYGWCTSPGIANAPKQWPGFGTPQILLTVGY